MEVDEAMTRRIAKSVREARALMPALGGIEEKQLFPLLTVTKNEYREVLRILKKAEPVCAKLFKDPAGRRVLISPQALQENQDAFWYDAETGNTVLRDPEKILGTSYVMKQNLMLLAYLKARDAFFIRSVYSAESAWIECCVSYPDGQETIGIFYRDRYNGDLINSLFLTDDYKNTFGNEGARVPRKNYVILKTESSATGLRVPHLAGIFGISEGGDLFEYEYEQ